MFDGHKSYFEPDGTYNVLLGTDGDTYRWNDQSIELTDGLLLYCYCEDGDGKGNRDDLIFEGRATFSKDGRWHVRGPILQSVSDVALFPDHWAHKVDWDEVRRLEDQYVRRVTERSREFTESS